MQIIGIALLLFMLIIMDCYQLTQGNYKLWRKK